MVRLMSYLLTIIIVLAFLTVVVPFALLAANTAIKDALEYVNTTDSLSSITPIPPNDLQFFKTGASVASMVVFMVVGYLLLFVQQHFWIVYIKKQSQYEVPQKWIIRYRYAGILAAWTLLMAFVFGLVAWALPIGTETNNLKIWVQNYWTRAHIYIAFIVITGVFGLFTIGVAAYINLQIAYDQQIKLVNEGIENGTYDPVTRKPIEQTNDINIKIHDVDSYKDEHSKVDDDFLKNKTTDCDKCDDFYHDNKEIKDNKTNNHDQNVASAGFLSSKQESQTKKQDESN